MFFCLFLSVLLMCFCCLYGEIKIIIEYSPPIGIISKLRPSAMHAVSYYEYVWTYYDNNDYVNEL